MDFPKGEAPINEIEIERIDQNYFFFVLKVKGVK